MPGLNFGVNGQGGFELRQAQRLAQTHQLNAVAQHVQRAALVQLLAQAVKQHICCGCTIIFLQGFPGLGLRGLQPGQHVWRVQGARAVVVLSVAFFIQPAVCAQVLANVVFKVDFFVQAHGRVGCCRKFDCEGFLKHCLT